MTPLPIRKIYRNSYDLVVIGNNLAGILTAALMAKRGNGVLLIVDSHSPYIYKDGPYKLNLVPYYNSNIGMGGFFKRVIEEIFSGKSPGLQTNNNSQIVLPDARLDLSNFNLMKHEFKREFPDLFSSLVKYYDENVPLRQRSLRFLNRQKNIFHNSFFERLFKHRSHKGDSTVEELFTTIHQPTLLESNTSPEVQRYINAQLLANAYGASENWSIFNYACNFAKQTKLELFSNHSFPELINFLLERIQILRGEVSLGDTLKSVKVKGGKIVQIETEMIKNSIHSRYVIINGQLQQTFNCFNKKSHINPQLRFLEKSTITARKLVMNIVVKKDVLPVGMKQSVLYIPKETNDLLDKNLIVINVSKEGDNVCPTGERIISCALYVKEAVKIDPHIFQYLYDQLCDLIPFLDEFTIRTYPSLKKWTNYDDEYCKNVLATEYNELNSLDTSPHHGIYVLPDGTPLKNTYLSGKNILPHLGLSGEFFHSLKLAHVVQNQLRIKSLR